MNVTPLRVPIVADSSQLGPGFDLARNKVRMFTREAEIESRKFTSIMTKSTSEVLGSVGRLGPGLAAGLAGFAGGFLAGGAIAAATEGLSVLQNSIVELSQTAADAKMAGIGVEAFQALQFAAVQSKVGVDALTDGLKELQLRADEFIVTGKGPAAEAFGRIGMTPKEIKERLKDPAEFLTEIMRRIHDLDKAAQIRILDELLGGMAGEQFIRFLGRGRDGLADLQDEARATGQILSKDIFDEAEKINAEFAAWAATLDLQVKRAAVGILSTLREIYSDASGATDPEDAGNRMIALVAEERMWTEQLADARATAAATGMDVDRQRARIIEDRIKAIQEEQRLIQETGWAQNEKTLPQPHSSQGGRQRYSFSGIDPAAQKQFEREAAAAAKTAEDAAKKAAEAYQRQADRINDVFSSLQFEREQLGRTAQEQELYNRLKAAGTDLTTQAGRQIRDEVDLLYARKAAVEADAKALEQSKEAQAAFNDSMKDLSFAGVEAFADLATGAREFTDVLDDLGAMLLKASLQAAFLGEGPLAGLFGSAKSGGILGTLFPSAKGNVISHGRIVPFAKGGVISSPIMFPMQGGAGIAGEKGAEGIFPIKRMSNGDLGIQGSMGGSQAINVTFAPMIDARGAEAGVEARIMKQLRQQQADLTRNLPAMVKDAQSRSRLF
ncbi:hypothetical protein FHS85_001748 [Rhodoligotrophos appendicifer]|uniref:phage tail tape measure protein n=1 Tax=Rhodoligotrophos appendicifer TaxID=987056 RepID=UPI001185961F|nr:phage tail tape measure protein [Rhodoligotrophos appendicifer]